MGIGALIRCWILHEKLFMKNGVVFALITMMFSSCSNQHQKLVSPAAPETPAQVLNSIKGKNYKVTRLGILSPFAMDSLNPVNWDIMKDDTSRFFQDYAKKQMEFIINFSKDSTAKFFDTDKSKQVQATYWVDNDLKLGYEEEKPGVKLRLKYADSIDMGGGNTASEMTMSYLIRGSNNKELILETGRQYNSHKLIVWMKAD